MSFKDRKDAAEQLGKKLEDWSKLRKNRTIEEQQNSDAGIILAIPRGGVIIGDVISSILDDTKLDIIVSRSCVAIKPIHREILHRVIHSIYYEFDYSNVAT